MSPEAASLSLTPTATGLAWRGLLAAASIALIAYGIADSASGSGLGLLSVVIGALAAVEVLRTPIRLRLSGGSLVLRGLRTSSCAVAGLDHVVLARRGMMRVPSYRFVRHDGTVAMDTDATLWDRDRLEQLLAEAGLSLLRA